MIEEFHQIEPYSLNHEEKQNKLKMELIQLTRLHQTNCERYANILSGLGYKEENINKVEDIPFLPVRVFKELDLKSIADDAVFKTMTSSGTTGNRKSKIFLDKENAMLQQKVMLRLLADYIGKKRLPMLVLDTEEVVKNRKLFTARGATIMGLDFAAKKKIFALNEDMTLNEQVVYSFLEQYGGSPFLMFGFTFMVWQHLFEEIRKKGLKFDFSKGYLLTGGGWKQLEKSAVTRESFKSVGKELCGLVNYVDHYGMSEQSGSIYLECACGHYHASIYSDIIIRRFEDFSVCKQGEEGIIQVVSVLPHSFPGHSLLTEDRGILLGEDDCPCGRKGKYFTVLGRMKNAELRGCSDTYGAQF